MRKIEFIKILKSFNLKNPNSDNGIQKKIRCLRRFSLSAYKYRSAGQRGSYG